MSQTITKNFIPLGLALLLVIISLVMNTTQDVLFTSAQYLGYTLVIAATFVYFFNQKWFVYFFFLILLAGTIHLISIFFMDITLSITIITFNPICLFLLALHIFFNKTVFDELFPEKKSEHS
ncbi:hypothetical protein IMCC3317_45150 [Kordia antarctica]|uniref:Uncharacterized protein n=1 Tax=Kordia antarctica TaxID=1218801 RepID=A0A7L4ZUX2_9FLAO|nr:hypothetical protein [Kordia antarctica]QHI39114.1 hypothetical protein IMCC3317_45150 [Kordia antarctica]